MDNGYILHGLGLTAKGKICESRKSCGITPAFKKEVGIWDPG